MNKAIYHISGFDCANCASHAEEHLNKHEAVQSASIDFNNERLFITFREAPLSQDEILAVIKEVEDDPIRLEPVASKREKQKLIGKDEIIMMIRIALSIILMVTARVLSHFLGVEEDFETIGFNWQASNHIIVLVIYLVALAICIYDVIWEVIENIIKKRNPIDEHLLMTLSCLGAFSIAFFPNVEPVFFDGVMVLVLFQIGELLEKILSKKSKAAISEAIDLRADFANLITDNKVVQVKPDTLNVGDKIIIHIGEIVPVDGKVVSGEGTLDTSSLTGETMPVYVNEGKNVISGASLKTGSITVLVEKVLNDSTISKIMELVENSGEHKSKVDKFITKFARFYTPAVLGIAIIFTIIFGLATGEWATALYRGVFVLIVGCPCAIVISVPLAYFAGIGLASKIGVVIKGANVLDQLVDVGVLFVDKTGTLTYGNFEVTKMENVGVSLEDFKTALFSAESRSNHPIAKAIILHQNTAELALKQENYEEIAGFGTSTIYMGDEILAGNRNLLISHGINCPEITDYGTVVYVAKNSKYIGYALLRDVARPKAKELISRLDKLGIRTVLLSGDTEINVMNISKEVGIKEYYSGLLPQEKVTYVGKAINEKTNRKSVVFAGDGINDTPSIMRADVGFAMGGIGSDVAVENADAVIMQDHPLKIYHAIKIARMTKHVAIFNIIFAITVKVIVMILTMVINNFPPVIDALSDTGLTVLLVINSLLLFYRKVE